MGNLPCALLLDVKHFRWVSLGRRSCYLPKGVAAGEVGLLWEREREEHRELPLHAMPPRANGGGSQSRDLRTRNDYSSTTRA